MARASASFLSLALLAASSLAGQDALTIHNRTGYELHLRREGGGQGKVLRVKTGDTTVRLGLDGTYETLLKDGATATLQAEDGELEANLFFWRQDPDHGVVFMGALAFTATGQDLKPGFRLAKGPMPKAQILPQNKRIEVLSDTELVLR
jgi:hypothetical protein